MFQRFVTEATRSDELNVKLIQMELHLLGRR